MTFQTINKTKKNHLFDDNQEAILIIILVIIAFAFRFYYMNQKPLWLDEFYGFQLGQAGLKRIIQNSLYDPNPPLYYLAQWAATGFGIWRSEWAIRWLSVAAGCFTVLLTYKLGRHYTNSISAFLGALLFAISPYHVFYSQEARSASLITLLSAVTMFILYQLVVMPDNKKLWLLYGLMTLCGLYANYSFVLITSIQFLYLFLVSKHRIRVVFFAVILGICCIPLAYFFWSSIPTIASKHAQATTHLWQFIQALMAGEPVRFGFYWGHLWMVIIYGILILPGLWWQKNNVRFRYYILQVFLPFLLFWGIFVLLLSIRLPLSEAKQFIVILPAIFVLVCVGIAKWLQIYPTILGKGGLFVLYSALVLISITSLLRYWKTPQSPESHAIRALAPQLEPMDAVVSLHHSLTAALSYYAPKISVFTKPVLQDGQYLFSDNTSIFLGPNQVERNTNYSNIMHAPRVWLLTDSRSPTDVEKFFLTHCQEISSQDFEPFLIRLLTDCSL